LDLVKLILVPATVLSPILSFLIYRIPDELSEKHYYVWCECVLFIFSTALAFNPIRIKGVTPWLHWYTLALSLYVLFFGYRYRFERFFKVLATGMFMVFLAGEWWEIPIFLYDYLGKIGVVVNRWTGSVIDGPWIFSHIRRVYTLAVAYLFVSVTGFRENGKTKIILYVGTLISFLMLLPFAFGTKMWFNTTTTTVRVICLFLMGWMVWEGFE